MNLTEMFRQVLSVSVMSSILLISLLIIKTLFRKKLSANLQYCIWFVLFIRLMLPFTFSNPWSVYNYMPHKTSVSQLTQTTLPSTKDETSTIIEPNKTATTPSSEALNKNDKSEHTIYLLSWFNYKTLAIIWVVGIVFIFLYIIYINLKLILKNRKLPLCKEENILELVNQSKSNLNLHSKVAVVYGDTLSSPALFNITNPKIIISPELIKRLSPEALRYVLLHELCHLKRGDLLISTLLLSVQVIYWFNPLTWYALIKAKQDCEMACDALALSTLKSEEKKEYGLTIINILQVLSEPYWVPGTLGFVNKINRKRIIMLSKGKKTSIQWIILAIALTFLAGCTSISSPFSSNTSTKNDNSSTVTPQTNTSTTDNTISNSPSNTSSSSTTVDTNSIIYKNTQYGFIFTLPKSWQGFSVVNSTWKSNETSTEKASQTGPMLSIRHPQWTTKKQRQDIPIMIFTLEQWDLIQKDELHIGAAPIQPTELARNNIYVFALPARYNFSYLEGYKEVEQILSSNPLQPIQLTITVKAMLSNMLELAKQGKVISCDYAVKQTNIDTVIKAWGQPNKTDYVASAKGTYSNYDNKKIVFGYNKGAQIFEVRSYSSQLNSISLAIVKEVFGAPAYDVKVNNQELLGYKAGTEFKIEFVFNISSKDNSALVIDHYNVLYPNGTVNSMAGDPGRQW